MVTADPLQLLINSMAEVAHCIDQPDVAQSIGEGLSREILYAVATCRQRFPDRWPGGQQPLALDTGLSEP